MLGCLQIRPARPDRSRESIENHTVDQERNWERPAKSKLDPVCEGHRPSVYGQAVGDVDLYQVAGAAGSGHHAALPASPVACREDFAPAGGHMPAARKL